MIQGTPVPGFPFLASIIGLFSGAQLLALGIMGEYLARMHARLQDRPTYVVREEIGQNTTNSSGYQPRIEDQVKQE
jgi:undecaprenyl-phosphate 4-deoxy-4-formamido-L-arabinose transferase